MIRGKFTEYRKSIVAAVGAAIAWGILVTGSEPTAITSDEWIQGGILLATALGVYGLANRPA